MTEPSEILPGVYIGDQMTANNPDFFRDRNIRRVVNCTPTLPFYFPHVEYFRVPVDDSSDQANNNVMAAYLPAAVKFILESKPDRWRGVLIHCHAGVSRSCTVGLALLRTCCATNLTDAFRLLLQKRPIAFMNGRYVNFRNALIKVYGS